MYSIKRLLWLKSLKIKKKQKNEKINSNIEIRHLNGYDAIREQLDENDAMTVKHPISNEKPKTKVSIGLN